MLKIRLIPCLDVRGGRVVKGQRFVNLRDAGDPVAHAKAYSEGGADELCFLDITASRENRPAWLDIIAATAQAIAIPLTVGGGVRTIEDAAALLRAGADKVAINSAGLADPELYARAAAHFGSQCIVAALDASWQKQTQRYELFSHGGSRASGLDAVAFARKASLLGAGEILLTSMDRDGTGEGFDTRLTRLAAAAVQVPVIASGGAGAPADIIKAVKDGRASAVLAASIFHFDRYGLAAVKKEMTAAGLAVRQTFSG